MGLGERLGKFDDENSYRADDPEQREPWGRAAWVSFVAVAITAPVLLAGLGALLGGPQAAFLAAFALLFVWLVGYVVWRRRRNFRRTGSPTKWPTRKAD